MHLSYCYIFGQVRSVFCFILFFFSLKLLVLAEFINPHGIRSSSQNGSESSSDRLSQFGTPRDYHDEFNMQNESYWYNEKDDDNFMTPSFEGPDFFSCQSEDKFVMTSETVNQHENPLSISYFSEEFHLEGNGDCKGKACYSNHSFEGDENVSLSKDYCCEDKKDKLGGELLEKEIHLNDFHSKVVGNLSAFDSASESTMNRTFDYCTNNDIKANKGGSYYLTVNVTESNLTNGLDCYEKKDGRESSKECQAPNAAADEEEITDYDLLKYTHDNDYEVFDLRIIHRRNRFISYSLV